MLREAVRRGRALWSPAQKQAYAQVTDAKRKMIISRFLASSFAQADLTALKTAFPNLAEYVSKMAKSTGAREDWALVALLVIAGFHCSTGRVFINSGYEVVVEGK